MGNIEETLTRERKKTYNPVKPQILSCLFNHYVKDSKSFWSDHTLQPLFSLKITRNFDKIMRLFMENFESGGNQPMLKIKFVILHREND